MLPYSLSTQKISICVHRPHATCAGCPYAKNCSRGYQQADWPSHETMCKTLTVKKAEESLPLDSNLEKSSRSDGNSGARVANSSSCTDLLELSTPALLQVDDG